MSTSILFIGIFLSVLIRAFFIINGTNVADIKLLLGMGETVLKGLNPYISLTYNSYPPLAVYIEAFTIVLSNISNIPFHILTKIWPNLADIVITLLLYKFLIKLKVKPVFASLWSLIFILNPISIITSSAHGQIDSIPSLLVLISIYLLSFSNKPKLRLSALILGLAIAIKPNPLILLPFFLIINKIDLRQKLAFLLICIAPVVLTFTPFILQNPQQIFVKMAQYKGVYDFSYASILRGFWYQQNAQTWLPQTNQMFEASKLAFIIGAIFLLVLFAQSKNLPRACLAVYLLFLGIYFGISAQYLSWILPLAILAKEKMIISFSISGTFALLGFYTFFGPDILFGRFWNEAAFQSKYMPIYFVGNLLLWLTILWWVIKIIKKYMNTSFKTFSPLHKRMVIVSLVLFIISLFPVLRLSFVILSEAKITQ